MYEHEPIEKKDDENIHQPIENDDSPEIDIQKMIEEFEAIGFLFGKVSDTTWKPKDRNLI